MIVSSLLPYLRWRTHKESHSRTRCSSMLKICLGARSNETLQEQQRALAKHLDMQKQQTTLQEHLQMFAKEVRPGVACLWRKAPLALGDRHPPSAAHFSSPEGDHQMFPLRTPQMAQSRGQALTGTAGLSTRDPQKGAGISMGSPQSLVFRSLWGGVSLFWALFIQNSLQMGRTAQGNQATW